MLKLKCESLNGLFVVNVYKNNVLIFKSLPYKDENLAYFMAGISINNF